MKKKALGIIAASAFAIAAISGPVAAAPNDNACFGQVHKAVNTNPAVQSSVSTLLQTDVRNVGDLVRALGGQGKNAAARGICAGTIQLP
jgi:hypothetical protein